MKNESIKYPSINGLRAISILLVLLQHLGYHERLFVEINQFRWTLPFTIFLQDGQMGVTIFFVISGFLITSLMLKEEAATSTVSLKNFYMRRVLRIFPAYYFMLMVYFLLQSYQIIDIDNASWLTALTFTKYLNWQLDWVTAHGWSLSIEENFYLFWPLIFIQGPVWRTRMVIGLILIVPFLRVLLYFNPLSWMNDLSIFTRIDSIAVGCLFAISQEKIRNKLQNHWGWVFWGSLFILFSFPVILYIFQGKNLDFVFIPFGTTHGTIANFLIGCIMMYSVFGPKNGWFVFLNLKVVEYVGMLSFSIYLWQQIFISNTHYFFTHYPQNVLFIFIAATCSYHFIEKPFLKLKSKFNVTN